MNPIVNKYVSFGRTPNSPKQLEADRAVREMSAIGKAVGALVVEHGEVSKDWVKHNAIYSPLIAMMVDRGWLLAGSGYFSVVFTKGDVAIKIGLKKEDSGAMYAAWARANQGKPGVPVIHGISRAVGCYLVVMDRCEPLRHDFAACPSVWAEYSEVRAAMNGSDCSDSFSTVTTAKEIREFFIGVAAFDLHDANVMLDLTGRLVITDPVSFSGGKDACDYGYSYYTESYTVAA